jgi:hypothetical protein
LKRDGTLWHWGTNSFNDKNHEQPSLRTFEPRQLGYSSEWARLMGVNGDRIYAYGWKRDGTAWGLHAPDAVTNMALKSSKQEVQPGIVAEFVILPDPDAPLEQELQPGIVAERVPGLDNSHWRSLICLFDSDRRSMFVGLRDDGTLWRWHGNSVLPRQPRFGRPSNSYPPRQQRFGSSTIGVHGDALLQIGKDSDWAEITGLWFGLTARKTNGSLWKWDWSPDNDARRALMPFNKPPLQLGTHSDWVAVGSIGGSILSLAADGSLWFWPVPWEGNISFPSEWNPLIAGSRKPAKIENIFEPPK